MSSSQATTQSANWPITVEFIQAALSRLDIGHQDVRNMPLRRGRLGWLAATSRTSGTSAGTANQPRPSLMISVFWLDGEPERLGPVPQSPDCLVTLFLARGLLHDQPLAVGLG
jgi:hypothetical protein